MESKAFRESRPFRAARRRQLPCRTPAPRARRRPLPQAPPGRPERTETARSETERSEAEGGAANQVRAAVIGGDGRFEKLILAVQALHLDYGIDENAGEPRIREMREAAKEIFQIDGVPAPVEPAVRGVPEPDVPPADAAPASEAPPRPSATAPDAPAPAPGQDTEQPAASAPES